MSDPPRPEARRAIDTCRRAGIRPILITGDHALTAEAVARELAILDGGAVVTGAELDAMSEEEFARRVEDIQVYARVSPRGRRPRLGLAASGLVHVVLIVALILVPILWPAAMPETERDYVRVLIYDPPPPPPPPLPKGSSLRPADRAAAPAEPEPKRPEPEFTAPVETPRIVEPPRAEAELPARGVRQESRGPGRARDPD
jgi:hypothetical protein